MAVQETRAETSKSEFQGLVRVGGVAALVAGVVFRRNLGAEIELFTTHRQPGSVVEWFELLQTNKLLGLSFLDVFDLANYVLLVLMILALYAILSRDSRGYMTIATVLGILGIAIYLTSNTAFSMSALSDQYAEVTSESQRASLLAAGHAMLAITPFGGPTAHPGGPGTISLLLVAVSGLITSVVMVRSGVFNRSTAVVGILASVFDLGYCIGLILCPVIDRALLAIIFIPAAGFFFMVWHIMVGWKLCQLGKAMPPELLAL